MHLKERRQVIFVSHRMKGQCARPDHFPIPSTKLHGEEMLSNRIWVAYVWLSLCSTSIIVYVVPGRYWSCSNFERTHERAITKTWQQRTRADLDRGRRVECTSCEQQASRCSSTAINEQEKLERKRALCLKPEVGQKDWTLIDIDVDGQNCHRVAKERSAARRASPCEVRAAIARGNQAMT